MQGIADDETRHAALSWQVAAWAKEQLTLAQREQLRVLRQSAIQILRAEISVALPPELMDRMGLPSPAQAHALLDQLDRELWVRFA